MLAILKSMMLVFVKMLGDVTADDLRRAGNKLIEMDEGDTGLDDKIGRILLELAELKDSL